VQCCSMLLVYVGETPAYRCRYWFASFRATSFENIFFAKAQEAVSMLFPRHFVSQCMDAANPSELYCNAVSHVSQTLIATCVPT
jgi:hypothetical protein